MVEYLLSRKRIIRAAAEHHGVYHVISYQRRLNAIKNEFFARQRETPLGKFLDWWDRTEGFLFFYTLYIYVIPRLTHTLKTHDFIPFITIKTRDTSSLDTPTKPHGFLKKTDSSSNAWFTA